MGAFEVGWGCPPLGSSGGHSAGIAFDAVEGPTSDHDFRNQTRARRSGRQHEVAASEVGTVFFLTSKTPTQDPWEAKLPLPLATKARTLTSVVSFDTRKSVTISATP